MKYSDLRDFIAQLESRELLKRIDYPVSPHLEMTVVSDKVLRSGWASPSVYQYPQLRHACTDQSFWYGRARGFGNG